MKELLASLMKFQSECPAIPKDKLNPFHKSKYADLDSIWAIIKKPLHDNGFVVSQPCIAGDGETVTLKTILYHISGQSIESNLTMKPTNPTPQQIGSAITYARRYALSALLGIVTEDDDDGNGTTPKPANVSTTPAQTKTEPSVTFNDIAGIVEKVSSIKTSTGKDVTYVTVKGISYSRWGIPSTPIVIGDYVEVKGITQKISGGKTYMNAETIEKVKPFDPDMLDEELPY